jgi:hypothetical protein
MAYTPQAVQLARYEPKTFRVTMSPATNITGHTFQLNIRSAGVVVLTKLNATFTIENAATGIFSTTVTSAETAALDPKGIYDYDIWRTNSGGEAQLALGNLEIIPQQWQT